MGLMLCGAMEACRIHNSKVGGSKPPKANAGFSSVGRAFDCSGYKHRIVAGSIPASLNWNFFGEIHPNLVKLDFGPIVQMVITCGFDSHNPSSNLGWTLEQLEEQMGSHVCGFKQDSITQGQSGKLLDVLLLVRINIHTLSSRWFDPIQNRRVQLVEQIKRVILKLK